MADQTQDVLLGMLKENTGRHFLDSGGAYGRAWERNQTRDLTGEEMSKLTVRGGKYPEIDVTHRVFHWLSERVRYDASMQAKFDAYVETQDADESWLSLMSGFFDYLTEQGHEVTGPYGGDSGAMCINTYNSECLLDQTLQFYAAEVDGEEMYLIQIHGGCDVRGGYTDPKAFTGNGHSDWSVLDFARATIACEDYSECGANWMNDGGSSWYFDGGSGPKALENFKIFEEGAETEDGIIIEGPTKGIIFVDEQKQAYCPCCGKGKLLAGDF